MFRAEGKRGLQWGVLQWGLKEREDVNCVIFSASPQILSLLPPAPCPLALAPLPQSPGRLTFYPLPLPPACSPNAPFAQPSKPLCPLVFYPQSPLLPHCCFHPRCHSHCHYQSHCLKSNEEGRTGVNLRLRKQWEISSSVPLLFQ